MSADSLMLLSSNFSHLFAMFVKVLFVMFEKFVNHEAQPCGLQTFLVFA